MRIAVDWDRCESNALRAGIAPHIFEVDDDDMLQVLAEVPDPADRPIVEQAVAACPKQALRIVD
ncbi:ferredoxin [Nocardia jinanensis]|uniref:Ferredoxin FdxD n=1 Tax=Nocardia jinanensis TaxID=382504 RepID=A0A917VST0_9NOCA|nr:ferredoxin [Nocardia jinanensis]GGL15079.1 putative ferredoxin FdxD [Nocardia jinanensis]